MSSVVSYFERRGKLASDTTMWCSECGRVELPLDGGDLCDRCIPRVNRQERERQVMRQIEAHRERLKPIVGRFVRGTGEFEIKVGRADGGKLRVEVRAEDAVCSEIFVLYPEAWESFFSRAFDDD